jgi:hypothetical protein
MNTSVKGLRVIVTAGKHISGQAISVCGGVRYLV